MRDQESSSDRQVVIRDTGRSSSVALVAALLCLIMTAAAGAQPAVQVDSDRKGEKVAAPPDPTPPLIFDLTSERRPRIHPGVGENTPPALPSVGGPWVAQGPAPTYNGQVEGITNAPVIGAIQVVVPHPTNADIIWVAAVNGGIWKTTNATAATPTWTPQTDAFGSLSMGALALDPTDATVNTLVAGVGRFSSFGSAGGPLAGLLRTTNGGTTWTALASSMIGRGASAIEARGATIVVAIDQSDFYACTDTGIFRSTDSGASFAIVSGATGSGLPAGMALDLAGDPSNTAVMYAAIRYASVCGSGVNGIYKSTNTGATWSKVSNAAMEALMDEGVGINNTRLAVGNAGEVYAGIIDDGQLAGLFRSANGGTTWTQLDTPATNEGGTPIGIQPRKKPGSQGRIHFSIAADPVNANIVYVGGDRQPLSGDGNAGYPNSIGAYNYTGRLFRVNAASAAGLQSMPLTHCQSPSASCLNTTSTLSNSAPHADSRTMAFNASGDLLEGDDGGIYRRTNPRGVGDWFSVMGNLRVTEMHDVAWDRVSNIVISGNQDTGTSEQTTPGGLLWSEVNQGDGGDVAVDDLTSATQSIRYTSYQGLGSFRRRTMSAAGTVTSDVYPSHTVLGGGAGFQGQFVTPVEVNKVDAARLLIAGYNDLYESLDRGDTMTATSLAVPVGAMVYGGSSGGVANPSLIYAISYMGPAVGGANVYIRTAGAGAPALAPSAPGTWYLEDVAVNPDDWHNAYVVNGAGQVFVTTNTGSSWTDVTGNLGSGTSQLSSIAYVPGNPGWIAVGSVRGVYRMAVDAPGIWHQWGTGLPNSPVWDLEYELSDDALIAGTMGRGAWKLTPVVNVGPLPSLSINNVSLTEGNTGTTNAVFTATLSATSANTVTVDYGTANGSATTGSATPSNGSTTTIPLSGVATPYPSTIAVSGLTGTVTNVTVTLSGFTHTYPGDLDVLLSGPGGQSVVLMSDAGGGDDISGITLTFADGAAANLPSTAIGPGTWKPTNFDSGTADVYPSPAPASGYGATMSVFNAIAANGTWSLYVVDDAGGDSGSISGWSLNFTTTGGDYAATSGTLTFAPGVTTRTIAVPVNGDAIVEPNETFFVNLSGAANATIADAQGQGTIANDDGSAVAPPTNVVATASGSTTVGISWIAAAGAATYRVYRSDDHLTYALVGSTAATSFEDATAAPITAYLYKVRSFAGSESGDSNVDLATTFFFTDPPVLTANVTPVKLSHFIELRAAVNAVRTLAGLGAMSFSAPAPAAGLPVQREHLLDLRAALDAARTTLTLSATAYTDPTVTAGTTTIKAAHLAQLRNGIR